MTQKLKITVEVESERVNSNGPYSSWSEIYMQIAELPEAKAFDLIKAISAEVNCPTYRKTGD